MAPCHVPPPQRSLFAPSAWLLHLVEDGEGEGLARSAVLNHAAECSLKDESFDALEKPGHQPVQNFHHSRHLQLHHTHDQLHFHHYHHQPPAKFPLKWNPPCWFLMT